MADSENIKEVVNQVALQVAMVVMMLLSDTETGPWPTAAVSHGGIVRKAKERSSNTYKTSI